MDNNTEIIMRNSAACDISLLKGMFEAKASCADELVQAVKTGSMDPKIAMEKSNKLETMSFSDYFNKLPLSIEKL